METPIRLKNLVSKFKKIDIKIELNKAPKKLYKKLETFPLKSINKIDFNKLIAIPSFKPKITKPTNTKTLESPNFKPGAINGIGIAFSNSPIRLAKALKNEIKISFFVLFISLLHPIYFH